MKNMEKLEFVFKAIRSLAWSLVIEGLLLVVLGILIYVYPKLLVVLVSVFFVLMGLTIIAMGLKVKKYSKVEIDF